MEMRQTVNYEHSRTREASWRADSAIAEKSLLTDISTSISSHNALHRPLRNIPNIMLEEIFMIV